MASKLSALKNKVTKDAFIELVNEARNAQGEKITSFKFKKNRCRLLTKTEDVKEECKGILYWMCRDCRVQDNWALLFAQRLALKHNLPLSVCVFVKDTNRLYPTKRHLQFLVDGLKTVQKECRELDINFHLLNRSPLDLPDIVKTNNFGCVVCDFFPLRQINEWRKIIIEQLGEDVPLVEVDAHNIVPAWVASDKKEVAARTMRPKIIKKLPEYLTGFPLVCKHPIAGKFDFKDSVENFDDVLKNCRFKNGVEAVSCFKGGTENGLETLRLFICDKLKVYNQYSNDPTKDAVSNLSPWLHFGQISAQRCALEVEPFKKQYKEHCERFLEEIIVRRELSDNFCLFNEHYDKLEGADNWAKKTLNEHRKDKRRYIYTKKEFEECRTHDNIWNSAQLQLNQEGKMHGYMRMYWCKKILEWTKSPEEAIEVALYLNDTYSLDGNDPNGFVGVMWSICGVHDHGWQEREIFGKVRYMVDYRLKDKFNVDAYCARYGYKTNIQEKKSRKRKLYD